MLEREGAWLIVALRQLSPSGLSASFSPLLKTRVFFYITTVQVTHSGKITLIQYYYLLYSPYLNFMSCLNNVIRI